MVSCLLAKEGRWIAERKDSLAECFGVDPTGGSGKAVGGMRTETGKAGVEECANLARSTYRTDGVVVVVVVAGHRRW